MHIKKFIFDFVDHEKRQCIEITIAIHMGKNMEWLHDENDLNGYIEWLTQHAKMEYKLKQEVDRIIKNKYFNGENNDNLMKFGDYVISKQMTEKKSIHVNMNQTEKSPEVLFRQTNNMEKTKNKYVRGPSPAKWTDMFNYDKICHHHSYHLTGNEMEENTEMREVSSFDIPQDPLVSIKKKNTKGTQSTNNQANIINKAISNAISNTKGSTAAKPILGQNQTATNALQNQTTRTNVASTQQQTGGNDHQRRYKQKYLRGGNEFY